ncbi:MAG: ABC transporter permease [Oscillospiraceae bacterium]|nr:ABC transporter permease [Oscillospiraceae bacterium]
MVFFITLKDIMAFFRSEKKVFIWLLICMISGSFVLNYSYSFARYTGEIYESNLGAAATRYRINGSSTTAAFDVIMNKIDEGNFPGISDLQLFGRSAEGYSVVGSSFISTASGEFTGLWTEGYAAVIDSSEGNACAVSDELLEYGERLKMVGEVFDFENEQFVIRGVYEMTRFLDSSADVVIFEKKYREIYNDFEALWINFEQRLDEKQEYEFQNIINEAIPQGRITYPPAPGESSSDIVKMNEIEFTAIIIMLMICLVSIIEYWQKTNISTYTIYWLNGATNRTIMLLALCESFVLCVFAYLAGLGLNALSRLFLSRNAALELFDIVLGFGVFFGVFAVFTLIGTAKICKTFSITKVRRD